MPTNSGALLGRAVLGTNFASPTQIIAPVPAGELWVVSTGAIANDTALLISVKLWVFQTGDTVAPPDQIASIFPTSEVQANTIVSVGGGIYLPAGSSMYGAANSALAAVVNMWGIKRVP